VFVCRFTGTAGTAVILPDKALLWTDGRYFLQVKSFVRAIAGEMCILLQPKNMYKQAVFFFWRFLQADSRPS